jgi:hypothetical protein
VHALPDDSLEYVMPSSHAVHWRSEEDKPAADAPNPAAHMRHGLHDLRPALAVKVPLGHSAQTMSFVVVAATAVYEPAAHAALILVQTRALTVLEKLVPAVHGMHWRSVVVLPTA